MPLHPTANARDPRDPSRPINVLIVDDSAVVRAVLSRELKKVPGLNVLPPANDPYEARDRIAKFKPDVLVLDVEMPKMDGITFLKLLMQHHPIPTIIVSSITPRGSSTAMAALEAGAVEVLCKPNGSTSVIEVGQNLVKLIRVAANARLTRRAAPPANATAARPAAVQSAVKAPTPTTTGSGPIIAIGASTGGVQALTAVLKDFPANAPATLVVQHMPPGFTAGLATRLNELCAVNIKEAEDGDVIVPHRVLIAPGGYHMVVAKQGINYVVRLTQTEPIHHQRPAVDVTFESVAKHFSTRTIATILTGMGADGADGLLQIRKAGGRTMAQDEKSCVVFGMPAQAIKVGAAKEVLPLHNMAGALLRPRSRRAA